MSAYDRMRVDAHGLVSIRDYTPPWADQRETWSVFDPGGSWLRSVTAPRRVEILQIGRDFILGIRRDTLDVERVAVFDLRRSR